MRRKVTKRTVKRTAPKEPKPCNQGSKTKVRHEEVQEPRLQRIGRSIGNHQEIRRDRHHLPKKEEPEYGTRQYRTNHAKYEQGGRGIHPPARILVCIPWQIPKRIH